MYVFKLSFSVLPRHSTTHLKASSKRTYILQVNAHADSRSLKSKATLHMYYTQLRSYFCVARRGLSLTGLRAVAAELKEEADDPTYTTLPQLQLLLACFLSVVALVFSAVAGADADAGALAVTGGRAVAAGADGVGLLQPGYFRTPSHLHQCDKEPT